jgi:hypothetical protein
MKQMKSDKTNQPAGPVPARTRRTPMSSKLVLSLAAALALSAASGVARADDNAPDARETSKAKVSPTNEQIDAAETGVPASVDYPNREVSKATPATNQEINAAEADNPYSPDNKDQPAEPSDGNANKAWRQSESDNPHSTNQND